MSATQPTVTPADDGTDKRKPWQTPTVTVDDVEHTKSMQNTVGLDAVTVSSVGS